MLWVGDAVTIFCTQPGLIHSWDLSINLRINDKFLVSTESIFSWQLLIECYDTAQTKMNDIDMPEDDIIELESIRAVRGKCDFC